MHSLPTYLSASQRFFIHLIRLLWAGVRDKGRILILISVRAAYVSLFSYSQRRSLDTSQITQIALIRKFIGKLSAFSIAYCKLDPKTAHPDTTQAQLSNSLHS